MNLEELLQNTKSKKAFLINTNGEVFESFSFQKTIDEIKERRIIAFSSTVTKMVDHFFREFLTSDLTSIVLKSNNENMVLVKLEDIILCLISDKNINLGVLGMTLQKEINKK